MAKRRDAGPRPGARHLRVDAAALLGWAQTASAMAGERGPLPGDGSLVHVDDMDERSLSYGYWAGVSNAAAALYARNGAVLAAMNLLAEDAPRPDRSLSTGQAAEALGLGVRDVAGMCRSGALRAAKRGGRWRVDPAALEEALREKGMAASEG